MRFRNMKTGNLLTVENEDAVAIMASSPNYEKVEETVATPSAPSDSAPETGNEGGEENAQETAEKAEETPTSEQPAPAEDVEAPKTGGKKAKK